MDSPIPANNSTDSNTAWTVVRFIILVPCNRQVSIATFESGAENLISSNHPQVPLAFRHGIPIRAVIPLIAEDSNMAGSKAPPTGR